MAIPDALKAKLVADIEQMKAEFMSTYCFPLDDIVVPCSAAHDVDELQLLLDVLFPGLNYRAIAVEQ